MQILPSPMFPTIMVASLTSDIGIIFESKNLNIGLAIILTTCYDKVVGIIIGVCNEAEEIIKCRFNYFN